MADISMYFHYNYYGFADDSVLGYTVLVQRGQREDDRLAVSKGFLVSIISTEFSVSATGVSKVMDVSILHFPFFMYQFAFLFYFY
jgi:hypothetical protein